MTGAVLEGDGFRRLLSLGWMSLGRPGRMGRLGCRRPAFQTGKQTLRLTGTLPGKLSGTLAGVQVLSLKGLPGLFREIEMPD